MAAQLTGEISTMFDALGKTGGSDELLAVIALVGPAMVEEEFDDGGGTSKYLVFEGSGTEVLLKDDVITSVFIRPSRDGDLEPYPNPRMLIDRLGIDATRDEVRGLLGDPIRSEQDFDFFSANGKYLHVAYVEERVSMLTPSLSDPRG